MQIAIDGPVGSGKSTISKLLAKQLNMIYLDTGAMYRAITYKAMKNNISAQNEDRINDMLKNTKIEFVDDRIFLDGEDCSEIIRSREVTNNTSVYSAIPCVREKLTIQQKQIASSNDIVMDGRDIGTVVLPNAEVKIFLNASVDERAKRRYDEIIRKGQSVKLEDIKKDIENRDYKDIHKKISPLKKADDAYELDSTSLSIDEVVSEIIKIVKR